MGKLVVPGLKILATGFSLPRELGSRKERELATIQQYVSIDGAIIQLRKRR